MGIKDANIWKSHFLKTFLSLFKGAERVQTCVVFGENGVISKITYPMATGWISNIDARLSWMVDHKCSKTLQGTEDIVLPITEREYFPLDTAGIISEDERQARVPLNNIAISKRREAFSRVTEENKKSSSQKVIQTIVWGMVILTFIVILVFLMRHH